MDTQKDLPSFPVTQPEPATAAPPNCALPTGSALQDWALDVTFRLQDALSHGYNNETRTVTILDLVSAIQLIHAGLPNLRDAERLDQLTRIGAVWQVIVRGQVVGSGNVRAAIDQAIERTLLNVEMSHARRATGDVER